MLRRLDGLADLDGGCKATLPPAANDSCVEFERPNWCVYSRRRECNEQLVNTREKRRNSPSLSFRFNSHLLQNKRQMDSKGEDDDVPPKHVG